MTITRMSEPDMHEAPLHESGQADSSRLIYTVGHSTRSLVEFIELLTGHGITMLVDVRSVPRSRHNPQFNDDTLPGELAGADIGWRHIRSLGGLRRTRNDSINTAWRNSSFRGFADYMQTTEFQDGIDELVELAEAGTVVVMCAEAVPWRCHRSLIADALIVRGIDVFDIMRLRHATAHTLTSFARVDGTQVWYPAG